MLLVTRFLLPAAFVVVSAGTATAQTLLLDDFDYPVGEPLIDHGWVSIRPGTDILVSAGSLSHPVYPHAGAGNSARLVTDNLQEVVRLFGARTSGAVYAAFLVRLDSVSDVFNDGIFFYLGPTDTSIFNRRATVYVNGDGTGNVRFGIRKTSGINFTGYDYTLEKTYLVVVKYEFVPGEPDPVSLWIDPDLGQPEPASSDAGTTSTEDALELSEVVLSQIDGGPTATVDGIYLGTVWPQSDDVFSDGFETGDTSAWTATAP